MVFFKYRERRENNMANKSSAVKTKTLTIESTPKTSNFNLIIDKVDFGVFKKHNVIKTTTVDTRVDLVFSFLTKETQISLRVFKDVDVIVSWNRFKGRFELLDAEDIIINEKTVFTKFSKVFYTILVCLIVLTAAIVLLAIL